MKMLKSQKSRLIQYLSNKNCAMRSLSALELLNILEQGMGEPPFVRALMLLKAAYPEVPPEVMEKLPIGDRDSRLITLREKTFGPKIESQFTCSAFNADLELNFDINTLQSPQPDRYSDEHEMPHREEQLTVTLNDYEIQFRLPTSQDLEICYTREESVQSHQFLLERCITAAYYRGKAQSVRDLPEEVVKGVVKSMEQADPQADIRFSLTCHTCGHKWKMTFDILSFFWTEIEAWAYRILYEVSTLASAFGWNEAEILTLSPWRRQQYLEMVKG